MAQPRIASLAGAALGADQRQNQRRNPTTTLPAALLCRGSDLFRLCCLLLLRFQGNLELVSLCIQLNSVRHELDVQARSLVLEAESHAREEGTYIVILFAQSNELVHNLLHA